MSYDSYAKSMQSNSSTAVRKTPARADPSTKSVHPSPYHNDQKRDPSKQEYSGLRTHMHNTRDSMTYLRASSVTAYHRLCWGLSYRG
jgi:hypothetical protein